MGTIAHQLGAAGPRPTRAERIVFQTNEDIQ